MLRIVYPSVWLLFSHMFFITSVVYVGVMDYSSLDTVSVIFGVLPIIGVGYVFLHKYNQNRPYPGESVRFWVMLAIFAIIPFLCIACIALMVWQSTISSEFWTDVFGRTGAGLFVLCLYLFCINWLIGAYQAFVYQRS